MLDHYRPDAIAMKLHILSDLHTEFSGHDVRGTEQLLTAAPPIRWPDRRRDTLLVGSAFDR
jgi:hypothetical protein